jgi:hypothetical protein
MKNVLKVLEKVDRNASLEVPVAFFGVVPSAAAKDADTLYFPSEITKEIGMSKGRINFLRNLGCKFYGRKTTIRWVREFLSQRATVGQLTSPPPLHLQYSA